jgi:His-Xaa-Ser system protein HxsD
VKPRATGQIEEPSTEVRIDLRIYPLLAVQKTAALLSRRCALELLQDAEHTVVVKMRSRLDAPPLEDPRAEFCSLLSDVALQEKVTEQTRDVRLALLRAAFHEALLPSK